MSNTYEKTPLQKTKGAVRNLTYQFQKCKQIEEPQYDPRDRFKPLKQNLFNGISSGSGSNNSSGGMYTGISSPIDFEKADNGRLLPITTKASSNDDSTIEYSKKFLPPIWVDLQEEIERHLEEASNKLLELKKLQQKRMRINFADEEDENQQQLQQSIYNVTDEITDLVKATESKLKEMIAVKSEDKTDEQIRKNIQITLATRLKDLTQELKKNEKEHFLKVQEIHGEDIISSKNKSDLDRFMNDEGDSQLQTVLEEEDELSFKQRIRSREIQKLVSTINDLAVLFKDLSVLVVEQGTILDRIDYNIEQAHKDVKQAVVHLENTKKIEKSSRARGCIICLMSTILVLVLLMVIKHH